jgi:hypothetical protein
MSPEAPAAVTLDQWLFMLAFLAATLYFAFSGFLFLWKPEVFTVFSDWWERRFGLDPARVRTPPQRRVGEKLIGLTFFGFGIFGASLAVGWMIYPTPREIMPVPRPDAWEFLLLGAFCLVGGFWITLSAPEDSRRQFNRIPELVLVREETVRWRTVWLRVGGIVFMIVSALPIGQWLRSLR